MKARAIWAPGHADITATAAVDPLTGKKAHIESGVPSVSVLAETTEPDGLSPKAERDLDALQSEIESKLTI
jgi:hypothetical protein